MSAKSVDIAPKAKSPAKGKASLKAKAAKGLRRIRVPAWIRLADSGIHGRGVYAAKLIPSGTQIIEYVGEKITKAESVRREEERLARLRRGGDGSVYIFVLNKKHDLDGRCAGNPARWINHSCHPNCRSENVRGHIWIVAKRDIQEGEELSFDYGFPLSEWRLHACRCGTKACIGYIVTKEQRWRVKKYIRADKAQAKLAKKA